MNLTAELFTFLVVVSCAVMAIVLNAIWDAWTEFVKRKDYESRFGQDMPERGGERNGL